MVKSGGLVGDDLMLRIIEGELDKLHGKVSQPPWGESSSLTPRVVPRLGRAGSWMASHVHSIKLGYWTTL